MAKWKKKKKRSLRSLSDFPNFLSVLLFYSGSQMSPLLSSTLNAFFREAFAFSLAHTQFAEFF